MGTDVRSIGFNNYRGLSAGGASVNQRATPMTKSLDGSPRSLKERVLPDPPLLQKPPTAPGKVETKYGPYKPGEKGGAGSLPAKVTTTWDGGAKVIVEGTTGAGGKLKNISSAQVSVPVLGGAGDVILGAKGNPKGGPSSIFGADLKLPVGRNLTLEAETNALVPNDGKGVVTTGVSLTAPVGASKVKADMQVVGAQEPGKSTNGFGVGVSVPLQQKDQAIEGRIGYKNNPTNARKDEYSATLRYKDGGDKSAELNVTTGANETKVEARFNIAKY